MLPFGSAGSWELAASAGCGAIVGWTVAALVGRPVDSASGRVNGWTSPAGVAVVMAVVAAGLWWWEVAARGQVPIVAAGADMPQDTLAWRWAGHLALAGFLAAASWIDLRDRVIPDAITLPGVLTGLAWAALRPDALLPVARAVPRSFAAPLAEVDVLWLGGPLRDGVLPAWLGAAPVVSGLGIASSLFVAWWLTCTAPAEAGEEGRRSFDPRLPALAAGLVVIGGAWWRGGDHWASVLSALAGLAVGVAVVWATRIGASRALGREALGFGDVTLMAVIGTWLGWQPALLTCCLGVLVGLVHGVVLYALARDNELPFGPSLCAGAALVTVFWRPLWAWLGPVFDRPLEVAAVAAAVVVLTALTLAAWWRLRGAR